MRTQPTRVRTGIMKKRLLWAAVVLIIALIAGTVYVTAFYEPPYTPPPFETAAITGVPEPSEKMGYGRIEAEGGFAFSVVGTVYQQEDGSLILYLTNHENSKVWLMCEVVGVNGKILYKSGVLRPGEYVERLYPEKKLKNEAMHVELKVYGFEPETYHSMGSVFLNNILQPW